MLTQIQPNHWSCLATAFAIVLDVPVQEVFDFCAHDGSEKLFPERPDPHSRRSFHIQEMVDFCYLHQRAVIAVEAAPVSSNHFGDVHEHGADPTRLRRYLTTSEGVLIGEVNGKAHAVVWDGESLLDPNGTTYPLADFNIRAFFAIKSISK